MQHAGRTRVPCVPFSHGLGRLRVLPLPIALPRTCRSRWRADQLTFAYTRSQPTAVIGDRLLYGSPGTTWSSPTAWLRLDTPN